MPGNDPARENEQLKLLLDVTRHMASTTELVPLLEKVAAAACQVLRCERATVFLLDRERNELYSKVATGAQEIRFPATKGIAGEVATTEEGSGSVNKKLGRTIAAATDDDETVRVRLSQ